MHFGSSQELGGSLIGLWHFDCQTSDGLGLPMDFAKKEPGVLIQNSLVLTFGRCLRKELEQPKGNNNSIYFDCWRTTVGRT